MTAIDPLEAPGDSIKRDLGITISGGGHRATLFGLGALIYFVDAGANATTTSIASVSGGSITNGFVGQTTDFRTVDSTAFEEKAAKPLATQIAKRGTLFAPFFTKLYLAFLIAIGIAWLLLVIAELFWLPWPCWLSLVTFIAGLVVLDLIFGLRGRVCARAFETTLFSPGGKSTPLAAVRKSNLDHVICASELRASQQVYFSGEFIYSYLFGHGIPADVSLARAVQASASFPGGFPAARVSTKHLEFAGGVKGPDGPPSPPSQLVMTDGGVYDNMGDQWARGFDARVKVWPDLGHGRRAPGRLIVVNASARFPWTPFTLGKVPVIGEVALLMRVLGVMYINTTNVRRQDIVASYDPSRPDDSAPIQSALVQISQSPFDVANFFAKNGRGPVVERARIVIDMLGKDNENRWREIAKENAAVATSLSAMGAEVTALLMYQAYVVTMCNLYVLFGDEYPLIESGLDLNRFRRLIS